MYGNINKNVEIKEEDRYFYNVLMEKRIVNPRDPLNPIVRKYLKVFRTVDYKKYFQCSQEDQIGFLKTMNYQAAELVHDPTIAPALRVVAGKSAEEIFKENKLRAAVNPVTVKIRKPVKK